jgi:hypothetical protein
MPPEPHDEGDNPHQEAIDDDPPCQAAREHTLPRLLKLYPDLGVENVTAAITLEHRLAETSMRSPRDERGGGIRYGW